MKRVALVFVVLLVALYVWWVIHAGTVYITINGDELAKPPKGLVGGWGVLVTTLTLFCLAILLAFVFAGIGFMVLGALVFAALLLVAVSFPFALPLLLPLFLIWLFVVGLRRRKRTKTPKASRSD